MELKPCPFCGKQVEMVFWDSDNQCEIAWHPDFEEEGVVFPYISCSECDASFYFDTPYGTGRAEAEAWNRRIDNG